jgi:signal peptidase I
VNDDQITPSDALEAPDAAYSVPAEEPVTPAGVVSQVDDVDTDEDDERDEETGFGRWLLETLVMVALAFLLAQGIKTFIVQPYVIPTGSMEPTIMIGDRVLAEKITYHFREPEPGDIVVFDDPTGRHPQLIKRVIAVGGQTIDINEGKVIVDGEALDEPYLHGVATDPGTEMYPLTVPDGEIWVMGDNRPNSGDSRFLGPQPESGIRGRAFATYWPISRIGEL